MAVLAVVQNIVLNNLMSRLIVDVPQDFSRVILNGGVVSLRSLIPVQCLSKTLNVYNNMLMQVFIVGLVTVGVTMIGSLGSGWKSVKA